MITKGNLVQFSRCMQQKHGHEIFMVTGVDNKGFLILLGKQGKASKGFFPFDFVKL